MGSLALAFLAIRYYVRSRAFESTNDAFIEADVTRVAPQVPGQVLRVLVVDNQEVKEGQLLVEIDPRNFEAALAQAKATLGQAIAAQDSASTDIQSTKSSLLGAQQRAEQARAQVSAAEADANLARVDLERARSLEKSGVQSKADLDAAQARATTTQATLDASRNNLAVVEAQVAQARDEVASAEAQLRKAEAAVHVAEAGVRRAELDLSYSRIIAPIDGRVTKKAVEPGSYVQVGQTLFALVPREVWVAANFKETQLAGMRPGQPVTLTVDAYPGVGYRGHVDSIQAGSGARFSLLPPENAVGNYVKVVQRVPVKILIDGEVDGDRHLLGPGMSVVPTVQVGEVALGDLAMALMACAVTAVTLIATVATSRIRHRP